MSLHNTCRIDISGEAGDGIITVGDLLVRISAQQGYSAASLKSFPSNIQGGFTQSFVTIATKEIVSPVGDADVRLCLSGEALHRSTVVPKIVLYDAEIVDELSDQYVQTIISNGGGVVAVPLKEIAKKNGAGASCLSSAIFGVLCYLLTFDRQHALRCIREHFSRKGTLTVAANEAVFNDGYRWADNSGKMRHTSGLERIYVDSAIKRLLIDGNQAIALGMVLSGCSVFASYPITPATTIGEVIAPYLHKSGGIAYQAEDEIAALGVALGASFTGAVAATATSGPGFSLMQEFIGYASMAELPVVIVDVQRAGPSTGMPTKHSQDDLLCAVYGGHGEGPRIVIAPVDVADCLLATAMSFACAKRYRCPVILLSDSALANVKMTVDATALHALETCKHTAAPTAPLVHLPATISGLECDADGMPVDDPEQRIRQVQRRMGKLADAEAATGQAVLWDLEDEGTMYDCALCSWGFTVAATREAVTRLRNRGLHIAACYPRLLFPLCTSALTRWKDLAQTKIIIEANATGQYATLVKSVLQIELHHFTMNRGEPIAPREIETAIYAFVKNRQEWS